MAFHAPGKVWPKGFLAWSRTDPAGSAAPVFKFRFSRWMERPQVRPGYMQLYDELLEYDAEGKVAWSSFVEGVKCHRLNWDMAFYPHLQLKEAAHHASSAGVACARVLAAEEPERGNMTFCLSQDGVPQSLNISLLASFSGGTNAGFYTISSTFLNVTSGPLPPDTFAQPKPCMEGASPVHCPYNVSEPTEVVTAVHYTHAAGKDCGLNNLMTNDLLGTLTFGPSAPYEFLQVYKVTVNKGFAQIQDCNYKPQLGQMVCDGGNRTSANAKSVGRSSCNYLEGEFQGQCAENEETGSWFSFPSVGECAAGWDVGFNGCTWKTDSFRVVKFHCVEDRCKSVVEGDGPGHVRSLACLQAALSDCPDFGGPMGPTCFSKPDPDILV